MSAWRAALQRSLIMACGLLASRCSYVPSYSCCLSAYCAPIRQTRTTECVLPVCTAGIVAGSEAALASAVVKAVQLQPRCVQFYIDRCERLAVPHYLKPGERDHGAGEQAQGLHSYLVCYKPVLGHDTCL